MVHRLMLDARDKRTDKTVIYEIISTLPSVILVSTTQYVHFLFQWNCHWMTHLDYCTFDILGTLQTLSFHCFVSSLWQAVPFLSSFFKTLRALLFLWGSSSPLDEFVCFLLARFWGLGGIRGWLPGHASRFRSRRCVGKPKWIHVVGQRFVVK